MNKQLPSQESTGAAMAKGWGILSQILYPPLFGFGLGWLIEQKFPAQGFWMLGLLLLFFIGGLYGVIKAYLLESVIEQQRLAKSGGVVTEVEMPDPCDSVNESTKG